MAKTSSQTSSVNRNSNIGATAVPFGSYRRPTEADFDATMKRVQAMSQEEMVQSLIDAGILTKRKKLAKQYRASA